MQRAGRSRRLLLTDMFEAVGANRVVRLVVSAAVGREFIDQAERHGGFAGRRVAGCASDVW